MYEYGAKVSKVVDGDTVDLDIDLGFGIWIKERCRLLGIDTPESRTRDQREKKFGKMATLRVKEILAESKTHKIKTEFDSKGKFGRTMVDFILPDGKSLCKRLVSERLAVPYHGENKADIRALHEKNWNKLEKGAKPSKTKTSKTKPPIDSMRNPT